MRSSRSWLRRAFAVCLLASAGAYATAQEVAPPAHPITPEQVKQLLVMTHTTDRVRQTMHTMIEQQRKLTTVLPPSFWDDFEVEINKIDWVALATPIYQRHLSEEDAKTIIAFYSTDVGQRSLAASAAISTELQKAGQELGKTIGTEVGQRHAGEIQERMRQQQKAPEIRVPDASAGTPDPSAGPK